MKRTLFIVCLLSLIALTGCANTPNQQYTRAAVAYDFAKVGAAVAELKAPALAPRIETDLNTIQQALTQAQVWLVQNPQLANVVGIALPPLEPFNIALSLLHNHLANLHIIDPTPPAPPTTNP